MPGPAMKSEARATAPRKLNGDSVDPARGSGPIGSVGARVRRSDVGDHEPGTGSLKLVGGASVTCEDGVCGVLGRIIIDPGSMTVTHLAVEPAGLSTANGRLVPIAWVQSADDEVRLGCTKSEFNAFDPDEVDETVPTVSTIGTMGMIDGGGFAPFAQVVLHQIPDGEIEVNSEENILATDGPAGHLRGLTIDPTEHRITQLLLRVGHLLAKKNVSLPIEMVTAIDGERMTLSLTKAQVADFA